MTIREKALRVAIGELGVKEQPAGSNWGPRVSQYLAAAGWKNPAPWCMALVQWSYKQAGHPLPYRTASVGFFLDWARKVGDIVDRPFRGDLVCYRWDADDWPDHIGIIERVLGLPRLGRRWYWVRTIEGNTSSGILGSQANGGGVYRRTRWAVRCSFVRVPGNA